MLALTSLTASYTPGFSGLGLRAQGAQAVVSMATPNAAPVYDGEYAAELRATASAMVAPGKGLLACDESTGTVGTRLEANGLENIEVNRMTWRNLLFTLRASASTSR